jgi:hypothetical protein
LGEESGSPGEKEKAKKTEVPMSVLMAPFADDSDPRDVNEGYENDFDFDLGPDHLPDFDRDDYRDDDDFYGDYPNYADYAFGDE